MARSPCEKEHTRRGPWSREEDERLTRHIMFHGIGRSWSDLPRAAGLSRCGKSCRLRWINYLQPGVKRGNFTLLEDRVIIDLHAQLGNKWSAIAGRLPGRTDNEIKNHWNTNLKRILLDNGIDPRTHKPLKGFRNPSTSTAVATTTTPPNKAINSSSSSNTTRTPLTDSATSMSVVTTNNNNNNSTTTTNAAPAPSVITTNKNKADKDKGFGFSSCSSEIQLFGAKMMKIGVQTSSAGENTSASAIIISSGVTTTEEVQVEAHPELNLELSLALPSHQPKVSAVAASAPENISLILEYE